MIETQRTPWPFPAEVAREVERELTSSVYAPAPRDLMASGHLPADFETRWISNIAAMRDATEAKQQADKGRQQLCRELNEARAFLTAAQPADGKGEKL
ncbi:hypothetical protein [Variovorax sp. PAMC26660]|uniref:hypothetical protein n=1 Tax=Variovorax sp. PAMC26660 TaxID=2762322 RepID=UPI00164DF333|nr:hypothetical protein [Variovorax sp. PAMC26660]QNK65879.1 hypothetical protein H7F35_22030 [Variovorax sp. PAMC26660]